MPNTQEEILDAWKTFVTRGIILTDKVRPMIARSWERCKAHGMDPWSSAFPEYIEADYLNKRKQYAELLSLAGPVMHYLYSLLNANISISDAEGFIFELITPLKHYPRTLGTYVNETTSGNGAITITLNEKVPIRTDGYEHYRLISHTYSNVSAPIFFNNTMIGTLNAVSPFGALPEKTLPMIVAAAKIIEDLLVGKIDPAKPFESSNYYKEVIDYSPQFIVVLDHNGAILTTNQASEHLFDTNSLKTSSFADSLVDKNDLALVLDKDLHNIDQREFNFKSSAGSKKRLTVSCLLLRKNQILLPNNELLTILVFDPSSSKDEAGITCIQSPILTKNTKCSIPKEVDYIGESPAWSKVDGMIHKTARFPSNVLLEGETGTGKEVVAKAIHRLSQRKGSFVAINCGALPKELLQSELFGYEEGAFTGARAHGSIGKFEHAHEGTLLLDEIGEMPLDMQVTLLRFLQDRSITRLSSNKPKIIDVRIVAATNKDMRELVQSGQFRQDLYYRLNVLEIKLPPLRERKSDIALLANHFILELAKQFKVQPKLISEDALRILCQYDWPGNVRELKNAIEKAMILSEDQEITPEVLSDFILPGYSDTTLSRDELRGDNQSERERIIHLLEQYDGNILRTAKALNICRNTLYRKIDTLDIKLKTSAVRNKN